MEFERERRIGLADAGVHISFGAPGHMVGLAEPFVRSSG